MSYFIKSLFQKGLLLWPTFDFMLNLVTVPSEAINMSLGLSMTKDPTTSNLAVSYTGVSSQVQENSVFQLR